LRHGLLLGTVAAALRLTTNLSGGKPEITTVAPGALLAVAYQPFLPAHGVFNTPTSQRVHKTADGVGGCEASSG